MSVSVTAKNVGTQEYLFEYWDMWGEAVMPTRPSLLSAAKPADEGWVDRKNGSIWPMTRSYRAIVVFSYRFSVSFLGRPHGMSYTL
jgi:hypothetical protein